MEYKDIEKVNSELRAIDVKGKDYVEVNQRILAFRKLYPEGTIKTGIVSLENGVVVIQAIVSNDGKVLGTGTAYEKENSTFINKTSYIENCETSAVGRALGMLGIGIDTSVASYEEVANAIHQQEGDKLISKSQATALRQSIENNMLDVNGTDKDILKKYGYTNIEEIKIKDYANIVNEFKEVIGGNK